ncbi:Ano7 [Vulpes lagopus]
MLSLVNLVFILVLSEIYVALARVLTRWEMHRTQTKFKDAFTLKVLIFQVVNFYSSPIYVAFFKGRFVGYPGNYHTLFGVRNKEVWCAPGGCLVELAQEPLVIMVGKQVVNNVQEVLVPLRSCRPGGTRPGEEEAGACHGPGPREADYELLPCGDLSQEYLETVLQFGFVTIFVAACPLAPLFVLLNNWVEVRLGARKLMCQQRRPVAQRAGHRHLGGRTSWRSSRTWQWSATPSPPTSCHAPTTAGPTPTTCAASSTSHSRAPRPPSPRRTTARAGGYQAFREDDGQYSPTYWNLLAIRLAFAIVFEHVVFSIGRQLDLLVPDIPESVEVKVKQEYYLAKQALAENGQFRS